MNKNISFNGFSSVPSDYNAADGDLALSLNCIAENGTLNPIQHPKEFMRMAYADGKQSLTFIHKGADFCNYIIADALARNNISHPALLYSTAVNAPNIPIPDFIYNPKSFVGCNAVGNTLIVITKDSMIYFLWKDGAYQRLGNKIPDVQLSFGLIGHPRLYSVANDAKDGFEISFNKINAPDYFSKDFSDDNASAITNQVMAKVNKFIADQSVNAGRFCFPFFVRYALRFFDGSHVCHSAPILMCPSTSAAPIVTVAFNGASSASSANCDIMLVAADLDYAFLNIPDNYNLADWRDIVTAIDVFVSRPIYNYDQDGKITSASDNNNFDSAFIGRLFHDNTLSSNTVSSSFGNDCILNPIDTDCEDRYMEWPYKCIYAMYFSWSRSFWEHTLHLPEHTDNKQVDNINSCCNFFKLASISVDNIVMDKRVKISVADDYLQSLTAREQLSDDYLSHDAIIPAFSHVFNSRLNLANIARKPFNGFAPQCVFAFTNGVINEFHPLANDSSTLVVKAGQPRNVSVTVYIREGGQVHTVTANGSLGDFLSYRRTFGAVNEPGWEDKFTPLSANAFFFYPNSNAFLAVLSMELDNAANVYGNSVTKLAIPLKPHDFLNGAFAFLNFNSLRHFNLPEYDIPVNAVSNGSISQPNKIFTSQVNNPFFFPLEGINTVGSGHILGIATATKALSEGQFGHFPLYAFTSDGIWALQTSDNGLYSARQPISRDVCSNPSMITSIDAAVVFPSDRGIMCISGSNVVSISDAINATSIFNPSSLPSFSSLLSLLNHPSVSINDVCEIVPLNEYLNDNGVGSVYDYLHKRLVIFSPEREYAYVYSFVSGLWATIDLCINSSVNAYPQALVSAAPNNAVYNFASPDNFNEKSSVIAITRPLKLGLPDTLKSVDSAIIRGLFTIGDVKSVIYASRDAINWFPVWSSNNNYLRGFSGSPFKYFRIALFGLLSPDMSLSSIDISFNPRFTNKLR